MAGHSHASNVMYKKNTMDKRRAKMFTKIARALTNAAHHYGSDPESNPRLKTLLDYARYINFPKENIQRAIQKSQNTCDSESLTYECFAGNVALIIAAHTDNRNRLSSQIRAILRPLNADFGKCMYLFTHIMKFTYENKNNSLDNLLNCDCDLIDIYRSKDGDILEVEFNPRDISKMEETCGLPLYKEEYYKPFEFLDIQNTEDIYKMIEELEDLDDVESVFCNITR